MKTYRSIYNLAALFWLTLGARSAMADKGIAFALITDGAAATVSAEYSFNPGGGAITATRLNTGLYKVVFPNTGFGSGWSVQTAAYGNNANYCNTFQFGGGGIIATCFDSSGMAADSPFSLLAISNTNDKNIAFALADQPSAASYTATAATAYNPSGAITITRSSAGTYQVLFGGLSGAGGTVQVSALGSESCYSGSWGGATFVVNVFCVNTGGNPVDSYFFIDVIPAGVAPTGLAYGFDTFQGSGNFTNPAGNNSVVYNPAAFPGVQSVLFNHVSTGQYIVTFNGLDSAQVKGGTVRATANGSAARCNVTNWQAGSWVTGPPGSDLQVSVTCYNLAGVPADTDYTLLALPATGYAYAYMIDGISGLVSQNSVNPGGVPVTATHDGTGLYRVTFPNSGIHTGWVVQAAAIGATSNDCVVNYWALSVVSVRCFNSAGVLADTQFSVLAVSDTNDRGIAFAYAGQASTASYTPSPDYSYNPAGSITVNRSATGSYTVVFNGLNSAGGTVQVAATAGVADHCASNGWNGSNFTAAVLCYDHNGSPVDALFTIVVIPAGAPPSNIAFGLANQPTTTDYLAADSYDSGGAGVGVTRSSTGHYAINFPGLYAAPIAGGYPRVTTYGNANRCVVVEWDLDLDSSITVKVACFSLAGAAADSDFVVLLFAPVVGRPASVAVQGGTAQSALVTTAFDLPLTVLVTDAGGNPVPNVFVLFSAPTSGASASFTSGKSWGISDSSGIATSGIPRANSTSGGPYSVHINVPGVATPETFSLTNLAATSVTLQTSPPGLQVSLDGAASVTAPHTFLLGTGSSHTIWAPGVQTISGIVYSWLSWSDSLGNSHPINVPVSSTTYTANFSDYMYELTIGTSPPAGGTTTPASGTFYAPATVQRVTAMANSGYSFAGWTGNVASASSPSTTVTMSAPETVTANFVLSCQPMGNSSPGVADVQLLINEALGAASPVHDWNVDGAVDLVDIQIELNAVLGLGCATR